MLVKYSLISYLYDIDYPYDIPPPSAPSIYHFPILWHEIIKS